MPRVLNKRTDQIPPDAVYVGRPTKWGNPFRIGTEFCPTREDAVAVYALHVTVGEGRYLPLEELRGKNLVCWCAPLPCHADVLLKLANKAP